MSPDPDRAVKILRIRKFPTGQTFARERPALLLTEGRRPRERGGRDTPGTWSLRLCRRTRNLAQVIRHRPQARAGVAAGLGPR
jgi:hypothetical protein